MSHQRKKAVIQDQMAASVVMENRNKSIIILKYVLLWLFTPYPLINHLFSSILGISIEPNGYNLYSLWCVIVLYITGFGKLRWVEWSLLHVNTSTYKEVITANVCDLIMDRL